MWKLFSVLLLVLAWQDYGRAADVVATNREELSTYRLAKVPPDAKQGLGSWIWTDKTFDRQTCQLWKDFDIPAGQKVVSARMKLTVDNGYQIFLDGRELGQGADWRALTEYDLTLLLPPGHHALAVNCFNDFFQAGLIMDLRIILGDGKILDIKSDETWLVVPGIENNWEKMRYPRAGWHKATVMPLIAMWQENWPQDYVTVPRFSPLIVPYWQTGWFHLLLAFGSALVLLACIALFMQLAIHSKEQQMLNLERARIARDIHDDFGTRLTRLVLEGEVAQSELADDEKARIHFSRISDGLRDALAAMDEVLWAVNPQRDTVRDFVTYLCEYAQTFLQSTQIQCLLEVEPDMPPLNFDLPLRRSLLLAVKEALANAAKHSGAAKLSLQIHRREPDLVVIVEDDGKGFDPAQKGGERNGLGNMITRMNEAGGHCRVISEPGSGCRVEFSIPLTQRPARFGWLARVKNKIFAGYNVKK